MKSSINKKLLIIALIGVAVGISLTFLGFLLGSKPGFYLDNTGIKLYDKKIEVNDNLNSFKTVSIDVSFTNVEIIKSSSNKISYYSNDGLKINHKIVDEQLIVNQGYQSSIVNFKPVLNKFNTLKIYTKDIDKLEISINLGNINIDGAKINKLLIDTDIANIKINSNDISDIKIKNKIGNIDIIGQTKKADIENIIGNISYNTIDNLDNYNYEVETLFGKKKIINRVDKESKTIKTKTTIGNISIKNQ